MSEHAPEVDPSLLLVDDEENLRLALGTYLGKHGFRVTAVASAEDAEKRLAAHAFDYVVTDVRMPGRSGMDLLAFVRAHAPSTTVVLMSAYGSVEQALGAIKAGAYDHVAKPFKPDELVVLLRKAQEREALRRENRALRAAALERHGFDELIGRSAAMARLFATIDRVAPFKTTVLVQGESGSGKELVARALHRRSPRAHKPFVAVNCGAIPATLLESELFGHRKGAFTDATQDKRGLFEAAEGGTLFLDEIGELPMALQVKLLRVLQEGTFRRLGDTQDRRSDVRLVAATLRDLRDEVREGRFREDLFYRLDVLTLHLPALRERPDDVALLTEHFITRNNARLGTRTEGVEPAAARLLESYPWPGNVRELENCIERAMVLSDGPWLRAEDLPDILRAPSQRAQGASGTQGVTGAAGEVLALDPEGLSIKRATRVLEETLIRRALERTRGNRTRAAELLEISHRALLYKLKEFGIR